MCSSVTTRNLLRTSFSQVERWSAKCFIVHCCILLTKSWFGVLQTRLEEEGSAVVFKWRPGEWPVCGYWKKIDATSQRSGETAHIGRALCTAVDCDSLMMMIMIVRVYVTKVCSALFSKLYGAFFISLLKLDTVVLDYIVAVVLANHDHYLMMNDD